MSYCASGGGSVVLKNGVPDNVLALLDNRGAGFLVEDTPDGGIWFTFEFSSYNDQIEDGFKALAPYVKSGNVEFVGEDGEHWRFYFHNGRVDIQDGKISYEQTTKYRTFNVKFQHDDVERGLVNDETQFDLVDADFPIMYCELNDLFNQFCQENHWHEYWVSTLEEVAYDGEEE